MDGAKSASSCRTNGSRKRCATSSRPTGRRRRSRSRPRRPPKRTRRKKKRRTRKRKKLLPARDHAPVEDLARAGDGVEPHLVPVDLRHHEALILVVTRLRQPRAFVDIPLAQLPARARDEVDDPALRFYALVEVVAPCEHDADAVLAEA